MTGPILFAAILMTFVGLCLVVIARQGGPWVIGTEREADGRVEYLCLGRGCEDIRRY